MIDLHLHTTASDGRLTPGELVERALAAGLTVMAVTDHDTTSAVAEVRQHAASRGIEAISGIEITAIEDGRDVHVLGYFIDETHAPMALFLATQRARRLARAVSIAKRLGDLGVPVDVEPILDAARRQAGKSIGRPLIAKALIAAGHVADIQEAFDKWLAVGCPGFVAREGPSTEEVVAVIHQAGGLVSLAHPGRTTTDERVRALRDAGLDALEVFHPDHDEELAARYMGLARELGLLMTGGSDFHGDRTHGLEPGCVSLPLESWELLRHAARPDA